MPAAKYWVVLTAVTLGACRAPVHIPYDFAAVPTRPSPVHALKVAIVPFEDARDAREAPDDQGRYLYNGLSYVGTRLQALGPQPEVQVTELVARHLARSRVFAQIIMVLRPEQAPEADLIISGKILRARGYVEGQAPPKGDTRPKDSRQVLAEVVLQDIEIRKPGEAQPLGIWDAGWSIAETRELDAKGQAPDPWAVMSEAMRVALDDWTAELSRADFSGALHIAPQVSLTPLVRGSTIAAPFFELSQAPPAGWQVKAGAQSAPEGWKGPAQCQALRFEARQVRRFSRVLGPYTPAVDLWACPKSEAFTFSARAEHPARLLGSQGEHWYLSLKLGRTNWKDAEVQIARFLELQPPNQRYIFEIGPGARPAPRGRLKLLGHPRGKPRGALRAP